MSAETTDQAAVETTAITSQPQPKPDPIQVEEPPPWPELESTELSVTYPVPSIFVSAKDGHTTLRDGYLADVIMRTEIWYTDKKQPDEEVFKVKAECSVLFGKIKIMALTDAGMHGTRNLMDSIPPAREYMKRVGERVNIHWKSQQVNEKSPFFVHMKRPVIFRNERVSYILP